MMAVSWANWMRGALRACWKVGWMAKMKVVESVGSMVPLSVALRAAQWAVY